MDRGKVLLGVLGGLVSGLALVAGLFAVVRTFRTPPGSAEKPPGKIRVMVRSAAAGGQLFIDGELCGTDKCEIDLKPGTHHAEVRKPGYSPGTLEFAAKPALDLELTPTPLPSVVEVASDLMTGELWLDKREPVALGGGGAQLTNLEPGEHQLRFVSGAFRADFKFDSQPGTPPRLLVPPSASGLRAIVVTGAGPNGRLWVTDKNAQLAVGAREFGLIPEEGLALPAMERGAHQFILKPAQGGDITFAYEIAENPTAWISLRTFRRLGTLRILTDVEDAKVILDGKDSGARVRRGRVSLLAAPGSHEVHVEKAGYLTPPEQRATVRESSETELQFRLNPMPTRALLPVAGAPPGTALAVDDKPAGTVGLDGSALVSDLEPGPHVVTARREGFLPGRWEVKVGAGRNAALQAGMQRALATLRVATSPAGVDAKLTVRRMGQFEERPITDPTLQLPEGDYTVTATDANGLRTSSQVRLEAGKETATTVTIAGAPPPAPKPAATPPPAPVPVVTEPTRQILLKDWDGAPGWDREGDSLVNEGGGIMLAPTRASAQSLTFTAHVRPGKAVRWVTQFRDINNYTLYEFRGNALDRTDVVGGKRVQRHHAPHRGGASESVRIRMNHQSGALHTSAYIGGQWVDLDTAEAPNGTGRFGFYIPEKERVAVSEFKYEYR
jgi:hypothetical protein